MITVEKNFATLDNSTPTQVRPSLLVSASILTAIHGLCPQITSATGFQVMTIIIITAISIIIITK